MTTKLVTLARSSQEILRYYSGKRLKVCCTFYKQNDFGGVRRQSTIDRSNILLQNLVFLKQ